MEDAEAHVKKAAEDRKLAEMLQASKKKKPAKGKAKDPEPEAAPVEKEEKREVKDEGPPDFTKNDQFLRHLRRAAPRAFTFGPIKFSNLDVDDSDAISDARVKAVVDKLHEVSVLGENRICVLGYKVRVKARNLKRRTCLLKHARFLKNLDVVPIVPEPAPTRSRVTLEEEGSEENE